MRPGLDPPAVAIFAFRAMMRASASVIRAAEGLSARAGAELVLGLTAAAGAGAEEAAAAAGVDAAEVWTAAAGRRAAADCPALAALSGSFGKLFGNKT